MSCAPTINHHQDLKQSSIARSWRRSLISARKKGAGRYALVYYVDERYANKNGQSTNYFLIGLGPRKGLRMQKRSLRGRFFGTEASARHRSACQKAPTFSHNLYPNCLSAIGLYRGHLSFSSGESRRPGIASPKRSLLKAKSTAVPQACFIRWTVVELKTPALARRLRSSAQLDIRLPVP